MTHDPGPLATVLVALSQIFRDNLLPLFLLMGLGFALQRRLGLEMRTLSRLNLWVFVPALAIYALSNAHLPPGDLLRVAAFVLCLQGLLYLLARGWARLRGYSVGLSSAFACSMIFYNSGNYGYPLIALLFGAASPAVGLQAIVLAMQNTTTFSLGQIIIRGPAMGIWGAFKEYLKMPFLYAILLGLTLQQTALELPGFLTEAIEITAGGLVPVALVTLGAQLALVRPGGSLRPTAVATLGRLVAGPALAFGLLKLLGWQGLLAQQLLISSSVPTAINTTLLAIEFENEPDFAAQTVLVTTLCSAVTVALVIFFARQAFPLG